MKYSIFILLVSLMLTSCGLKKPLQNPDIAYPNEADCQCDTTESE